MRKEELIRKKPAKVQEVQLRLRLTREEFLDALMMCSPENFKTPFGLKFLAGRA
jgi:hypothetical protein